MNSRSMRAFKRSVKSTRHGFELLPCRWPSCPRGQGAFGWGLSRSVTEFSRRVYVLNADGSGTVVVSQEDGLAKLHDYSQFESLSDRDNLWSLIDLRQRGSWVSPVLFSFCYKVPVPPSWQLAVCDYSSDWHRWPLLRYFLGSSLRSSPNGFASR